MDRMALTTGPITELTTTPSTTVFKKNLEAVVALAPFIAHDTALQVQRKLWPSFRARHNNVMIPRPNQRIHLMALHIHFTTTSTFFAPRVARIALLDLRHIPDVILVAVEVTNLSV